jgi:hypothetical protein
MKFLFATAISLFLIGSAAAQHKHGAHKGPNGGAVEDVAGVHAEFVASGTTVTFNILDENNKPLSAKGMTGSVLIVNGADKETVKLSESGENALKGDTKKAVAPKSSVTLMLKTPAGKSGQARFTMGK